VLTIKIIRPASRESSDLLPPQITFLEENGFRVRFEDTPADQSWTYSAGTAPARADILTRAVLDPDCDVILAARGGYGASDLLPLLPWEDFRRSRPKLLVGFSDISALHSAFYAKTGWRGLHGPMPATTLWRKNGDDDIKALLRVLQAFGDGSEQSGSLSVTSAGKPASAEIKGKLFGGCFTVLSNLIGTPYMPESLGGHIFFFEDTDENPARLMRALNQWLQSGLLEGISAVLIGHLKNLGEKIPDCADYVYNEFARRLSVPVFRTGEFGHTAPNFPLMIGADAVIADNKVSWRAGAGIA
jgi:muramoyltetrapeptide carboxypeptidase